MKANILIVLALLNLASIQAQAAVIVDDVFTDGIRTNTPIDAANSVWLTQEGNGANFSGLAATPSPNFLVASNVSASSRFFMSYFTTNSAEPNLSANTNAVDLAVGQQIQATLIYTPTNIPAVTANSVWGFRFGLFDLADGGGRTNRDNNAYNTSSATIAGTNILGYFIELNHVTTLNAATPLRLFARTNTDSLGNNLLSTASTNCYLLGSGPAVDTNAAPAGFVSGTTYTLVLTVARYADSNVFTAKISGGPLSYEASFADTSTYTWNGLHRFDSFGIRSNRKEDTCDFFTIHRFKVETMAIPSGGATSHPPFNITSTAASGGNAIVTWASISGRSYEVLSTANLATGPWVTNATVSAAGTSTSYTNTGILGNVQRFFRILAPPQ